MTVMPAPVILRPTPPGFLATGRHGSPAGPAPVEDVLGNAKWFATIPEPVAREGVLCLLNDMDASLLDPNHMPDGAAMDEAYFRAGERMLFYKVAGRFFNLMRAGIDPTVLLALRGTRLTHADRLMVAQSGLSPDEAHDQHRAGTLDMDTIRTMVALRQTS